MYIPNIREIRKIRRILEKRYQPVNCHSKLEVQKGARRLYLGWISRILRKSHIRMSFNTPLLNCKYLRREYINIL